MLRCINGGAHLPTWFGHIGQLVRLLWVTYSEGATNAGPSKTMGDCSPWTSSQHGEANQVYRFVLSATSCLFPQSRGQKQRIRTCFADEMPFSSSLRNRVQRVRGVWFGRKRGSDIESRDHRQAVGRNLAEKEMEYFKNSLKSVLGTAPAGTELYGADGCRYGGETSGQTTVFYSVVRRKDACRTLKALSCTYRVELGAQEMDALRQVLEINRTDCEIIGLALDTLCNITNPETFDEEVDKHGFKNQIGEQFTEIFIKHSDSVGLLLTFLEEFDFRVRWPVLKLLTHLLANRSKDIQEIIMVSPMGVSKLMDLLSDSKEVTRNDVC